MTDTLRKEVDALGAAVAMIRADLCNVEMRLGVTEEEADKRLMWYAALERLAVEVGAFLKTGEREPLEEIYGEVRLLHRYISPAVPRERMPRPA